jgi:hypothetical protein
MKVLISSTLLDLSRFFPNEPGRAFEIEIVVHMAEHYPAVMGNA